MLQVVGQKAAQENLPIARLQANLVELDGLRDAVADYAICLFSTLGMIRGRQNRQRALDHFQRILKPGGLLVLHVHNVWHRLWDAAGRRWLVANRWESLTSSETELGDRFFDEPGVAKMFVHTFSRRELLDAIRQAGLHLKELIPLAVERQRPLRWPWLLSGLRATGWIAVCEKRA
jgi:ubiquinone/menaquinone biosynthesis C-methylase UbiE